MQTFTITFGDQAENHVGMQKIGTKAESGFNYDDLINIKRWFDDKKIETNLVKLNSDLIVDTQDAYLLIIKRGLSELCDLKEFFNEQKNLQWDTKAKMYGRVVNKHARHNLCYSDFDQEPDYENGKGRIVNLNKIPILKSVKDKLEQIIGIKGENMAIEGNNYYDVKKCGIGFHGDSERKKVVGIRSGASIPLVYRWFYKGENIGNEMRFVLDDGDMYVMSEKAIGTDWKKKNIYTLRHAAGAEKFLKR